MRVILQVLFVICICVIASGCGKKGGLKTPSQIEAQEAKKAREAEKKKAASAGKQAPSDASPTPPAQE